MNKPLYIIEFPNFGDLDVQLPDGFIDVSDKSYYCPGFTKECESGLTLSIMIDCADVAARIDRGEGIGPRFECNSIYIPFNINPREDIYTDDWATVLQWVKDNEAMT